MASVLVVGIAFSIPFTIIFVGVAALAGDPWWYGAFIGPVLTVTLIGTLGMVDYLRKQEQERKEARSVGRQPERLGHFRNLLGWSADHRRALLIGLILALSFVQWARQGAMAVILFFALMAVVLLGLAGWKRVRQGPD